MQEERRGKTSCRRSSKDRRRTGNRQYKGLERRRGSNRRAVKGLAIGILAGALFLGGAEKVTAGRRRTDTVLPQNTELILKQTPVSATALPTLHAKTFYSRRHVRPATATQPEITLNAAGQTDPLAVNDGNARAVPAGILNNSQPTSPVVTADKEAGVFESGIEAGSLYRVPRASVERVKRKVYLAPGPVENKADRIVLASLLPKKSRYEMVTPESPLQADTDEQKRIKGTAATMEIDEKNKTLTDLDLHLASYYSKSRLLITRPGFTDLFNKSGAKPEPYTSKTFDFELPSVLKGAAGTGFVDVGAALTTHVLLHEFGHHVVADHVEATGAKLNFLTSKNGQFFLASSTVDSIDERSRLPYNMGGEWAADLTFEFALNSYRRNPDLYNKSLLFLAVQTCSGTRSTPSTSPTET